MRKYQQNKRELLKEKCLSHLGGKICCRCGDKARLSAAYAFHHITGDKEADISEMINKNMPFEEIKKELSKCKVLCASCHSEVTHLKSKAL